MKLYELLPFLNDILIIITPKTFYLDSFLATSLSSLFNEQELKTHKVRFFIKENTLPNLNIVKIYSHEIDPSDMYVDNASVLIIECEEDE